MHICSVCAVCVAALGLAVGSHAQVEWTPTSGPSGGEIRVADALGATAACATDLGVYISTDGARTWRGPWRPDPAGLPGILSIEVTPSDIFVSTTQGALARTPNRGQTWELITNPAPLGGGVIDLESDGARLYALVASTPSLNGMLVVSDDHGDSWSPLPMPASVFERGLFVEGATVWATAPDTVSAGFGPSSGYRSADGGQTWTLITGGPDSAGGMTNAATPTHRAAGRLWAPVKSSPFELDPSLLFHSSDDGATWTQVDISPVGQPNWSLWDHRLTALGGEVFLTGYRSGEFLEPPQTGVDGYYLWKSSNLSTWSTLASSLSPSGASVPWIYLSSAHTRLKIESSLVFFGDFGVIRSDDGGATWSASGTGIDSTVVWAMTSCDRALIANVVNTNQVWALASPSSPWQHGRIFDDGDFGGTVMTLFSPGGNTLLSGHLYEGITRSTDGGLTWNFANAGVPQYNGTAGQQYSEIGDFCSHNSQLFAVSTFGLETPANSPQGAPIYRGSGVLRSLDGGLSWQRTNTGLPVIAVNNFGQPMFDPLLSIASTQNTLVVGGAFRGVFRSANSGASWTAANSSFAAGNPPVFNDLLAVGTRLFAAADSTGGHGGVWTSDDAGLTWQRRSAGLPTGESAFCLAVHGGDIYVGLAGLGESAPFSAPQRGVFKSSDDGDTWTRVGDVLTGLSVRTLVSRAGTLYAGTEGAGVWKLGAVCAADINNSGAATVQDIYDFLELWLASDARADFNGQSGITVQDIYDYFEAWLTGCD